jgi:hypothetical protein
MNEELLKKAAERAYAEAVHESEIEARAMIYYRAAVIGFGIGPLPDVRDAAPQPEGEKK